MKLNIRWLLVAAAGIVPAFAVGYAVSGWAEPASEPATLPVESAQPQRELVEQPAPNVVFPDLTAGPRPAGTWDWSELRGGECVDSFVGAFEQTFRVVSCDTNHEAQFVRAQIVNDRKSADYPGDQSIREIAQTHCVDFDLEALNQPASYDDLVVAPSYSLGEAAWERGDRLMGCFVYRQSGQPFAEPLFSR